MIWPGAVVFALAIIPTSITWDKNSLRPFATHTGRFYRYAPCTIVQRGVEYCWNCQNATEGVIKDSIYLTERRAGRVTGNQLALAAGPAGAWDGFHVCDPSIVGGHFRYAGRPFQFALFYLGNHVNASRSNQIGVAFGNDLHGPWLKDPLPIIPHTDDGSWGVGQPSAITEDKSGRVLLFYTAGDRQGTRLLCRRIRLQSDTPAAHFESDPDITVPTAGLTGSDGRPDPVLHNADVAYDPTRKRFYAVREQHPHPTDYPTYISASVQVVSILASNCLRGQGAWRVEGEIGPSLTHLPRSHNAGLVRTLAGALPDFRHVRVIFTGSGAGPETKVAEWTYDLWEITGALP